MLLQTGGFQECLNQVFTKKGRFFIDERIGKYIMGESIGSLCYAAPEILRGESYVGPECDVWSLGVIIFALRAGVLPFIDKNKSTHETRDMIIEKHYVVPPEFSVELRHLLSQIFVEPDKRIDLEQVLSHPWMAERDM